ncbi:MAG: helix-hairpin-helix domain-containing protein, partial [Alphaproteobacteria bacterium]
PDEQLSLAIGRRGQNVRLASMLTGWDIDILTEEEESDRRQQEFMNRSKRFIDALDIDDVIAHLLVTEGFTRVEEVAYVPIVELAEIEGFDEDVATELQTRARNFLEAESERLTQQRKSLGVADELAAIEGLTPAMLVALGENGIKTVDDFAGLASDELTASSDGYLREFDLNENDANAMIMAARVAAGWVTAEEVEAARAAAAAAAEQDAADAEA